MLETVLDVAAAVCLVTGCLMSVAAAIGLVRFPDLLTRMHAGTKPQVFGLLMLLAGVGLATRTVAMLPLLVLAWIFQLLTVPVSAHMVGRSTYRSRHLNPELLTGDDLRGALDQASAEAPDGNGPGGAGGQPADGSSAAR